MPRRPLCFVLMPPGKKPDPSRPGQLIDFEALYLGAVEPGIEDAGMEAVRAREELAVGAIHRPTLERLLLCNFAVVELSLPGANALYAMGLRQANRPDTTLPVFADHTGAPFDVATLRAMPYRLGPRNESGEAEIKALRQAVAERLKELHAETFSREDALFELLERHGGHDKTDVFRERVIYDEERKRQLAQARALEPKEAAIAELSRIEQDLGPFDDVEAGVLVDLYLSYRALGAFAQMLALHDQMPVSVRRSVLVREQRAFALNRLAAGAQGNRARREEAIALLQEVLGERGPNPETLGILGRIYKDRWQEAVEAGAAAEARGHLGQAIDAYRGGFEADCRDAYPGINAVTLLDVDGEPEALRLRDRLMPVVQFAVERRLSDGTTDYWDSATLLELAIVNDDEERARRMADQALAAVRESWEPATTARTLGLIARARRERNAATGWLDQIIAELERRAARE
jgi:tetratricopeptide (TPR) repeat protein